MQVTAVSINALVEELYQRFVTSVAGGVIDGKALPVLVCSSTFCSRQHQDRRDHA